MDNSRYGRSGVYTLLSEDSIISKMTTLFNCNIQIIGRSCEVSDSVNSSSTASGNYLFENYHFTFQGELEITETCPYKDKMISRNWTFLSSAEIILPITCSIKSSLINCGAVQLHSKQTKEITLEHHKMKIIRRENTDETKAAINETDFIMSPDPVMVTTPIWDKAVLGLKAQS